MKYIKKFAKIFESSVFEDIFDWIKSEYPDCDISKVLDDDKIKITIDHLIPIDGEAFHSRCYANITLTISDYAKDHDYKVEIDGKTGEYGNDKYNKETWRKSKTISASRNELTYVGVKNLIKSTLDPYI